MGVALAATFVIAIGATTMRFTAVVKEMNLLFNDQVMVVSNRTIVIQAIPVSGSMLPEELAKEIEVGVNQTEKAVPVLFITPIDVGAMLQPTPVNFSIGVPVEDWRLVVGPTPLRGNGIFPTNDSSNEVVVGASLADENEWRVGTETVVEGYLLRIVGVFDTKAALLGRSVVMPLKLAQKIYGYPNSVNVIAVKPASDCSQEELADAIMHDVNYVKALTQAERYDIIQPVIAEVEAWNLGLATVIFVMSLVLVMTVTVMSVSERRRDFATLEAIGIPLGYVFRVVIVETVLIGVLGGVLGIVFGSFGALVLASVYTNLPLILFFPSIFEIVPPLYMLEIFVAVVAVCAAGGIVPALTAIRMRVAEVLRAEY